MSQRINICQLLLLAGTVLAVTTFWPPSLLVRTLQHTLQAEPLGKDHAEIARLFDDYLQFLPEAPYTQFRDRPEFEIWDEGTYDPTDTADVNRYYGLGFHFYHGKCSAAFFQDTLWNSQTVDTLHAMLTTKYGEPEIVRRDEEYFFDIVLAADIVEYIWQSGQIKRWIEHNRTRNRVLVVFEDTVARARIDHLSAQQTVVSQPVIVDRKPAIVPDSLLERVSGRQIYQFLVDEAGNVSEITLIRGDSVLVPYARRALESWRFTPGYNVLGEPMKVLMSAPIEFQTP